jgi:hypothetical protein
MAIWIDAAANSNYHTGTVVEAKRHCKPNIVEDCQSGFVCGKHIEGCSRRVAVSFEDCLGKAAAKRSYCSRKFKVTVTVYRW